MWQSPGGEVEWFREIYGPDARASYFWKDPDTVEIRIWRKRERVTHPTSGWQWQKWLDPYGKWHETKEAQWCYPSKIITKEEALRMQIKELKSGLHVLTYDMDRCAACMITGRLAQRITTPCPGWNDEQA